MSRQVVPGDIGLAMIVWPHARTMTAPAICYQRPRCRVRDIRWPYVIVMPWPRHGASDAPTSRVHVDNLRRTDPAHHRRAPTRRPPADPGGWSQLLLFQSALPFGDHREALTSPV